MDRVQDPVARVFHRARRRRRGQRSGTGMCGIAGRFSAGPGLPNAGDWAARADRLLAHRGPDGSGHFVDEHCELVHRRLALIDLSPTGRQPMTNETGDIQIIFNGEIYNHRSLRAELRARGHTFRSTSDTEVLIHLYEERGEHLAERLRGIFAFAIYDAPRRRLLLVRDRFGVKPLFYASLGSQLVFASEMKAITALPDFRPELDRQACCDFLGLGYIPEPATGFANIRALSPGTILTDSPEGRHTRSYYSVEAHPQTARQLEETLPQLAERLLAAVKGQAVADVPVAALLSGDGGDEAFGGYQRFWRANRLARLMRLPAWARSAAARVGHVLASRTRDMGRQLAKAVAIADEGRRDSAVLLAGLSNYMTETQKQELLLPPADRFQPVFRQFDGYRPAGTADLEELSRRMTETLFTVSLPSDMLRKVDVMSMRAGS